MEDVIKLYLELRNSAKQNGNEIAHTFSIKHHEDPAAFFSMAFNSITMTLELLNYYSSLWKNVDPSKYPNIEESKKQNWQRVNMIQKMNFIEIMSSFEFSAKKTVLANNLFFEDFSGRIYLSKIMKRSHDKELIGQSQLELWNGAIRLRNSLVHNNGISEETAIYNYPEVTVKVDKNMMSQGNLKHFGLITKWLLNESNLWIENANKSLNLTASKNAPTS